MANQFYSVGELAQILRCCEKWLYQQLNKGNIPGAFRFGKSPWFIDREIFHSTLKQKAQTPKTTKPGGNKSRHGL